MKAERNEKWETNNLMSQMNGSISHGSFNGSEGAKKGAGAGVNKSLVGPYTKVNVSPTTEAAKKGTGADNDFGKICRLADDHSLSVTYKK